MQADERDVRAWVRDEMHKDIRPIVSNFVRDDIQEIKRKIYEAKFTWQEEHAWTVVVLCIFLLLLSLVAYNFWSPSELQRCALACGSSGMHKWTERYVDKERNTVPETCECKQ